MVDTGFNENLTLPPWAIERLGLRFEDETSYVLGDGVRSTARVFTGEINWIGEWREITIVELEHDALLGTGIMMGCNLSIDLIDGGIVEIRKLG